MQILQKNIYFGNSLRTFSGLYINISKSRQCVLFLNTNNETLGLFLHFIGCWRNTKIFHLCSTLRKPCKKPHDVISFLIYVQKSKSTDRNWDLSLNCTQQGHQQGHRREEPVKMTRTESLSRAFSRESLGTNGKIPASSECLTLEISHWGAVRGWET